MVRRIGYIFEEVVSFENLLKAFYKAKKGAGKTEDANRFFYNLESEIAALQIELMTGDYQPGEYRKFTIYEPKERVISVAPFRDRVVHHAVVSVLEPIFEKVFIHDSYATRKKKGTHKAVLRAQEFIRKNRWFLKSDIKSYFASIDVDILLKITKRKIKDPQLMALLEKIFKNGSEKHRGLPIGNLTSQFFANVYLNIFDHFVKEELKVKEYIRYMDDFVVFSEDKEVLKAIKNKVRDFLSTELKLTPKESATYINSSTNGLGFLGKRVFPGTIRIKRENLKRSMANLKKRCFEFENNAISELRFTQSIASITEYLSEGNTYKFRNTLI